MGTLSTSSIAGSLLGPMIGGYIGDNFGLPDVFSITGLLMLVAFLTTVLFVRETFTRHAEKALSIKEIWSAVPEKSLTIIMFVTYFVSTLALYSVEPIITVYVTQLSHSTTNIVLTAGIIFSASGLANIIAAPGLGKLSDKIGPQKIILVAIIIAGVIFIPQAFVTNPWQLMALRFILGLATAGLGPSVNTILKRITPDSLTGRVF